MINPGEHVAIFGMTGSGKSTLTRKVSGLFSRLVVFDRLGEWHEGGVAHDFVSFRAIYRANYEQDAFTIIFRPRPGLAPDDFLSEISSILALIYQVEAVNKKGIGIVFEEAWLYAPLHQIPPWLQETMLTGRHHRISVIANAQRPATVSKTLVSQARHLFIGQFYEYRDRKYYEDMFGKIPELAQAPAKFHFYWFKPGEKPVYISTM